MLHGWHGDLGQDRIGLQQIASYVTPVNLPHGRSLMIETTGVHVRSLTMATNYGPLLIYPRSDNSTRYPFIISGHVPSLDLELLGKVQLVRV